jgi:RimJ/RimL family protein N-acetyltransferase
MQSNPKVMQYADGEIKNFDKNKEELKMLISRYTITNNDFWIYAVVKKSDNQFIGTIAIVKDAYNDNEIGYRFLNIYWGLGYGFEICKGLISYCKKIGLKKIIAYVVDENSASVKILEKNNFTILKKFISDDLQLPETKYQLKL